MNPAARIGLLGGTLDPIHFGHLDTALAARQALALDRVIVLPSRVPPHRQHQPVASPFHRFAMAALAVNGVEGLRVSDIELRAPGAVVHGRHAGALAQQLRPAGVADFLHHRRRRVRRN